MSAMKSDAVYDYAIVGMGIGGLATGALLASAGHRVAIFERHHLPGGYGQTFRAGQFSFCAELHYVWDCGPGQRVYRMLEKLGLETEVRFRLLDPNGFDRVIAPGIDYTIGSGFNREHQRLAALFPQHERALGRYFQVIQEIYEQVYKLPAGYSLKTVAAHPLRFSAVVRYLGWTVQDLFDSLELPEDLQLILAGQSLVFCLPPKRLSLLAHAAGVGSYNSGAYVPEMSYEHVMHALLQVIKRRPNCRPQLATEVQQIHVRDGLVWGLTTSRGETIRARHVIFDGDPNLSLDLIGREHFPPAFRRRLEYSYSISAISVYLGLTGLDLAACGLGEATVYWHPSTDLNAVYDRQFAAGIPDEPHFCFDSPTLRMNDPRLAPPGGHQLVLVAPCSYDFFRRLRDQSQGDYQTAKEEYSQRLIGLVERHFVPDLSRHIATKVVGSPLTNERFVHAPQGNCYGMPLDPQHVNLGRLTYRSPFPNFFYIGATSAMPGFAAISHFACLLYEKLTGDFFYSKV